MSERALSFGAAAAAYERFRPGYPDALVDEVLSYAGQPVRSALEIGAGTGKATRAFAARGVAVTATEPDAAMLDELRKHVPSTVVTRQCAFEDVPLTRTYDLVFAAASLHWTRPEQRWSRVVALLDEGGVFASFGGPVQIGDPAMAEVASAVAGEYGVDERIPSPDGTPDVGSLQWPGTELSASEHFTDVRQVVIERRFTLTAGDYLSHLATVSAYLQLPPRVREELFGRLLASLPETVPVNADVVAHLARVRAAHS